MKPQLYCFFLILLPFGVFGQEKFTPQADQDTMITLENVRFTILTPGVIHMEYSADDLTTIIFIPKQSCSVKLNVKVKYPAETLKFAQLLDGRIGQFNRFRLAGRYLKIEYGYIDGAPLSVIITQNEQTPTRIEYNPSSLIKEFKAYDENLKYLPNVLKGLGLKDEVQRKFFDFLK